MSILSSIKKRLFAFILMLNSSFSIAQQPDFAFEHLGTDDGLHQNSVFDILQDENGFMWFANQIGVSRFDGEKFELFGQDKNIYAVNTIKEDTFNNRIILGHARGITSISTKNSTKNYSIENKLPILDNIDIEDILVYDHEIILATSQQGKLYLLKNNKIQDTLKLGEIGTRGDYKISRIQNKILVSIRKEIYQTEITYENDSSTLTPLGLITRFQNPIKLFKKISTTEWIVGQEKSNALLIQFEIKREGKVERGTTKSFENAINASSAIKDSNNKYWIGTTDKGILYYPASSEETDTIKSIEEFNTNNKTEKPISANQILTLYESTDGVVWIGTRGNGIDLRTPEKRNFKHLLKKSEFTFNDYFSNLTWTITKDTNKDSIIWIGTSNGLIRYNLNRYEKGLSQRENSIILIGGNNNEGNKSEIYYLIPLQNEKLIVGTREGLYELDTKKTKDWELKSLNHLFPSPYTAAEENIPNILHMLEDSISKTIWFATNSGVFRSKIMENATLAELEYVPMHINENNSSTVTPYTNLIYQDSKNRIWFGTENGIKIFDNTKKAFLDHSSYSDLKDLEKVNILCLLESKDPKDPSQKFMWVGTDGKGLYKFNLNSLKKEKKYGIEEGLFDKLVYGILQDDVNNFWLSTNGGIFHFRPDTEIFTNYIKEDGLQSDEFNAGASFKMKYKGKNILFFGGVNGITEIINPEWQEKNITLKHALILEFQNGDNAVYLPGDVIILEPLPIMPSFRIASFDYRQLGHLSSKFKAGKRNEIDQKELTANKDLFYLEDANSAFNQVFKVEFQVTNSFGNQLTWEKSFIVKVVQDKELFINILIPTILVLSLIFALLYQRIKKLQKKEEAELARKHQSDQSNLILLGEQLLTTLTPEEVIEAVKQYIISNNWKVDLFGIDLYNDSFKLPNGAKEAVLESKFTFIKGDKHPPAVYPIRENSDKYFLACFNHYTHEEEEDQEAFKFFKCNNKQDFADKNISSHNYGKAIMCVALMLKGSTRPVGVMKVESRLEDVYTDKQLDLFKTLAKYAANALKNAQDNMNKTLLDLQMKRFKDKAYNHFVSQSISGFRGLIVTGVNNQESVFKELNLSSVIPDKYHDQFIYNESFEKAIDATEEFGSFIREVMDLPLSLTLEKEKNFLNIYVDIQKKARSNRDKITLQWPDLDTFAPLAQKKIPSMILQLIIENSLTYGLNFQTRDEFPEIPLRESILIDVQMKTDAEFLIITIEDNGIGLHNRKKLQGLDKGRKKSRAIDLTNDRIGLINKIMKSRLLVLDQNIKVPKMSRIEPIDKQDIYNDPENTGTIVELKIPLIYDFDLLEKSIYSTNNV